MKRRLPQNSALMFVQRRAARPRVAEAMEICGSRELAPGAISEDIPNPSQQPL